MAYEAKPLRVPMKPSPSAIYSNLCMLGTKLAYAHTRTACVVDPATAVAGKAVEVRRVDSSHLDFIHTVRALPHGNSLNLIVCNETGIQVWDREGTHVVFAWSFPDADITSADAPSSTAVNGVGTSQRLFARGACINTASDGSANVCFGASDGALYVLQMDETGRFRGPSCFRHHTAPITALSSAYQSRHGRWTEDLGSALVSADDSGAVAVWDADSAGSYRVVSALGESQVPAVALAVRNDFAVVARLDGSIQVFSLRTKHLRAEVAAHSRYLTCMDIHPTKDLLVTGAEDGTIAVTTLPIGAQKTSSLMSVVWMHAAVAGVAFHGPTLDDVAAVAYDTDELQLYKAVGPS